jgi:hypothetical protein
MEAALIILAATHHDPDGQMIAQAARVLPALRKRFAALRLFLTPQSAAAAADQLRAGGADVQVGGSDLPLGHLHLGRWRRAALAAALAGSPAAGHYLFCDFDRALHWAESFPAELDAALRTITAYDCTVIGRTPRAFASHPAAQRETEALANRVFALVSGRSWDVMAAARGLSRAAAALIVATSTDDSVGSDCSWPLLVRGAGGMHMGYLETEGMEFETLDRLGDAIDAAGGRQAWIDRFDSDPQQWLARLDLARAEVAAAMAYAGTA